MLSKTFVSSERVVVSIGELKVGSYSFSYHISLKFCVDHKFCLYFSKAIKRVDGNHKGVLTRERQPKASAHILRSRYQSITLHHCHRCTGDELFDYLLRYRRTKRHSYDFEKPIQRLRGLIRSERVNTTIDRRSVIPRL